MSHLVPARQTLHPSIQLWDREIEIPNEGAGMIPTLGAVKTRSKNAARNSKLSIVRHERRLDLIDQPSSMSAISSPTRIHRWLTHRRLILSPFRRSSALAPIILLSSLSSLTAYDRIEGPLKPPIDKKRLFANPPLSAIPAKAGIRTHRACVRTHAQLRSSWYESLPSRAVTEGWRPLTIIPFGGRYAAGSCPSPG